MRVRIRRQMQDGSRKRFCVGLTLPELPPVTEFKPVKVHRVGSLWEGRGTAVVCGNPVSIERTLHQENPASITGYKSLIGL